MTIQIGTPVTYQQALEDMPLEHHPFRKSHRQYPALVLWSTENDEVDLIVFTATKTPAVVSAVIQGDRNSEGRCWIPLGSKV